MRFLKLLTKNIFKRKELFSEISGNEDIKWTLQKAIENLDPVHILLVGEPGLGKTRFLKAIEKEYPDLSYFALASGSSGAGMINYCFENAPRFLLIDEIEDMRQSDQATLLSLLQDGCLVETNVFATCNSIDNLKPRLLSRFAVIEMKFYETLEEFKQVTMDVLKKHPLAEFIAEQVYKSSTKPNIRDCVRLASMCQTEQDVLRLLRVFKQ